MINNILNGKLKNGYEYVITGQPEDYTIGAVCSPKEGKNVYFTFIMTLKKLSNNEIYIRCSTAADAKDMDGSTNTLFHLMKGITYHPDSIKKDLTELYGIIMTIASDCLIQKYDMDVKTLATETREIFDDFWQLIDMMINIITDYANKFSKEKE